MANELQPILSPAAGYLAMPEQQPSKGPEIDSELESSTIKKDWIVLALFIGSFLSALDTTIVTTLLPTIASDLDASSQMSWIATSYLLSCSAFQPLYGKLSDIFGRKPLLIWSNLCFGVGCIICGAPFTKSLWVLCLGRFISGVGGGGLTTLSTIITSDIIPLRQRGVYQGMGNIVFSLGCASGSLIGALLQQHLGWRWAFLVQVPLSLFSCIMIVVLLHLPKDSPGRGLISLSGNNGSKKPLKLIIDDVRELVDVMGSFSLIVTMLLLMIILSVLDNPSQLSSGTWVAFVTVLCLAGYVFVSTELSIDHPMVPLHLLGSNRTVLASSLTNWFFTMSIMTLSYYIPVFWQTVYHFLPWQIGVRTVSNFFGIATGSMLTGIYMKRSGKYKTLSSSVNFITVVGVLVIFGSTFNAHPNGVFEYLMLFVPGCGYASMLTVTLLSLIASVDSSQQAQVTSVQYAFRAIGSTLGVSFAGLIYQSRLHASLFHDILHNETLQESYSAKQLKAWCYKILENNSFDVSFDPLLQSLVTKCFQKSSRLVMGFAALTITLGFLSSLFIREHTLHTEIGRR
ncbi:hypothetical protein C6P43_000710 [Kluyveromyces marxianus]|nr:hypothetical protein C6P43_000710 [Kluyveromyces marxianus]